MKAVLEARPESLADLREMIAKRRVHLGSGLETVARYLLDNPFDAAFGTCRTIASRCRVSTATVNRLASSFGFGKYSEFRDLFRQTLRSDSLPMDVEPVDVFTNDPLPDQSAKR